MKLITFNNETYVWQLLLLLLYNNMLLAKVSFNPYIVVQHNLLLISKHFGFVILVSSLKQNSLKNRTNAEAK